MSTRVLGDDVTYRIAVVFAVSILATLLRDEEETVAVVITEEVSVVWADVRTCYHACWCNANRHSTLKVTCTGAGDVEQGQSAIRSP